MSDKIQNRLPDKISEMIRVSIREMRQIEGDFRFKINMGKYWNFNGEQCEVCAAGAMLLACGVPYNYKSDQSGIYGIDLPMISNRINKMLAINAARLGCIKYACHAMDLPFKEGMVYGMNVTDYREDKEAFYQDFEKVAVYLESFNY